MLVARWYHIIGYSSQLYWQNIVKHLRYIFILINSLSIRGNAHPIYALYTNVNKAKGLGTKDELSMTCLPSQPASICSGGMAPPLSVYTALTLIMAWSIIYECS